MSSSTSAICGSTASRSQSAPAESSLVGESRGRAFKRARAGQPDDALAKKIDEFYLRLQLALECEQPGSDLFSSNPCKITLPPTKRAKTDGVLLGPRLSTRDIPPLELEPDKVPFTRPDAVLGALSELKLN